MAGLPCGGGGVGYRQHAALHRPAQRHLRVWWLFIPCCQDAPSADGATLRVLNRARLACAGVAPRAAPSARSVGCSSSAGAPCARGQCDMTCAGLGLGLGLGLGSGLGLGLGKG